MQRLLQVAGSDADTIAAMPGRIAENLAATHCRAERSTLRDNRAVKDEKIATVVFTCQVTALDSLRPLFKASVDATTQAGLKPFMDAYVAALRTAPRREVSGSIDLYPTKDGGAWYSGNLDTLVTPVIDALLPFDTWQQEEAAQRAPVVTGVASCDLLLAQHRSCVTRTAPEQLPGVEVMAEELKANAQVMTPLEMAQQCKALRTVTEAMWDTRCH